MIYLLDTSGLVRLPREPKLQSAWYDAVDAGAIASCYVQRTEFLYSARDAREYDAIAEMFTDLCPDVPVPKNAGRWISAVQLRMAQAGEHRSASAVHLASPPPPPTTAWLSSTTTPTTGPSPGRQPT